MAKNQVTGILWPAQGAGGERLEWTTLRSQKGGGYEEGDTYASPPGSVLAPAELARELAFHSGRLQGVLHVAIPARLALMKVVDLPTTDSEEIKSMVQLQVDRISPFPADTTYISCEVLARRDTASRVLIGAVRKPVVDALGKAFSGAGLTPSRVDIDLLAWWRLITDSGKAPRSGRYILLLMDSGSVEMMIVDDGVPVTFSSLVNHEDPATPPGMTEVVEELEYALTSVEAEWGGGEPDSIQLWYGNQRPGGLESLEKTTGLAVKTHPLESLPRLSAGLARRAVSEQAPMMDLAPAVWRKALEAKALRTGLIKSAAIVLAAWLVLIFGFLTLYQGRRHRLETITNKLQMLEEPASQAKAFKDRIASLSQFTDRTYSVLECMRETSNLLPPGVELLAINYKKSRGIGLRGVASQPAPVIDFIANLEKSGLFGEIVTEYNREDRSGQREFKINALLAGGEDA